MAQFKTSVNTTNFKVELLGTLVTDCADTYTFEVTATNGDNLDIDVTTNYLIDYYVYQGITVLSNNAINCHYISNGVRTDFINNTSVVFDTSLIIKFSLENSGKPGYYNNLTLEVINNDVTGYTTFTQTVVRENDKAKCIRDCDIIQNDYGLRPPQLFNPIGSEVISGTKSMNLIYGTEVGLVSINGQILDDNEYSFTDPTLTLTPVNGFDDVDDEILVFQNKI